MGIERWSDGWQLRSVKVSYLVVCSGLEGIACGLQAVSHGEGILEI